MIYRNSVYRIMNAGWTAIFTAALFLSAVGCDTEAPDFRNTQQQAHGQGTVQVNLASASSETAAPLASVNAEYPSPPLLSVLPGGLAYTVTFSAAGQTSKEMTVTTSSTEETLAPGLWQVEARARLSGGGEIIAQGSGEVQVIGGRTVRLNIALAPVEDSGSGTFAYAISNLTPGGYTVAKMDVVDLKDNSLKAVVDFKQSGLLNATTEGYAAGYYQVRIVLEKKTAAMAILRAVKTEIVHIYEGATTAFTLDAAKMTFAYQSAPALFFDHGTRITDADTGDWDDRNTYYVATGTPVVLAPVIANAPANAVYEWAIENNVVPTENKEYLTRSFSAATDPVQVKVAMKVDAVTHATASALVKAVTPAGARAKTGTSIAQAALCVEFSPAPGQFVGAGNGYSNPEINGLASKTEADVKTFVQDLMDGTIEFKNAGTDGKVFSLGGWGGYYTVHFDHSVVNKAGMDIAISGNFHVAGMAEPGVVWVSQDLNGDGKPNEIWYRLKGSQSTAKPRYAVTYFKPSSSANAFWIDSTGNNRGFTYYGSDNGFPYHLTGAAGTFVTFTGVLLDEGSLNGYVDSGATQFDIADAVNEKGESANLTHIDFVKTQTGLNKNDSGLGEYSTEAGIPTDLHF
jgi:hypothetical protein